MLEMATAQFTVLILAATLVVFKQQVEEKETK